MSIPAHTRIPRQFRGLLFGVLLAGLVGAVAPASSPAAVTAFGSPLSVPATLNTAEDLNYYGTYTPVMPSPEAPTGVYHTRHYGADAALWNAALASGQPSAPAAGQALKVGLEGCAQPAAGGPPPLTQIHFQDLSPLPGGGAKVNVSSQPFDIPVCGQNGAGGSTVTSYEPTNLCVSQGDYVDLNEEGGFVEHRYQNGVPYQVLGAVPGSTADSFIRGNGTGNGATFSSSDRTTMDGFASNQNEELMLQATLGTGPDATPLCPGGTRGVRPLASRSAPATPVTILRQTDGVNHQRIVAVAIYCRLSSPCQGVATLAAMGRLTSQLTSFGGSRFNLHAQKTTHVRIRVSSRTIQLLRKHRSGVQATLSAVVGGKTVSQTIRLKIF
jgi:hypothetical protein